MQSYDSLVLFSYTYEDNLCGSYSSASQILSFHLYLVRRNDGHSTPQDNFLSEEVDGSGRNAAPCTFTLEGGYSSWMSDEETWLFPYEAEQFIEVIRSGSTITGTDAVGRVGCGEETEFLVVDEFSLLTFLETLD